ncbi:hypothetical protein JCM16358_11620 [Halanaerocella petrolearia]
MDSLDKKLFDHFKGKVVRKDLINSIKSSQNVPRYVLEYLIGKYCASPDEEVIKEGMDYVRKTLSRHFVRADEGNKIKSKIRENRRYKLIDHITVELQETQDKYWGRLTNSGIDHINVSSYTVQKNEKMLQGGIWAILELRYDETREDTGTLRPFVLDSIKPIQIAKLDFEEFKELRKEFTTEEWLDILIRTIGFEPNCSKIDKRIKLLLLTRLIPLVESNYNLVELGPRSTGKSYIYRQLSPYSILVSGTKVTPAKLYYDNRGHGTIGLVGNWDVVAFDEISGIKMAQEVVNISKDYMEDGSFSRGGNTQSAQASMVFIGNHDVPIKTLVEENHEFISLPDVMGEDLAFLDRIHAYLPGWEMLKTQSEYFTDHYGFVVDYITEVFRESRKFNYTNLVDDYFEFSSELNSRDLKAVKKTISGLVKLLHINGECTKEEMRDYVELALELRRRVKEQLNIISKDKEYSEVEFKYRDKENDFTEEVVLPEY